ncbi:hypothetical protein RINTHH_8290 [Richelia intracellularis HH01]|uniref:Uncharacterized protein n=1 Tax=Richelia intracellularis HH01 TaxID=1165094 RepID=M1WRK3_9NOST|nr:hypothetical protein RINTHH_8290 [Richelia intracellularis HH01]
MENCLSSIITSGNFSNGLVEIDGKCGEGTEKYIPNVCYLNLTVD